MLPAKIPAATRRAVYKRDGHACALCERAEVIPRVPHRQALGRGQQRA